MRSNSSRTRAQLVLDLAVAGRQHDRAEHLLVALQRHRDADHQPAGLRVAAHRRAALAPQGRQRLRGNRSAVSPSSIDRALVAARQQLGDPVVERVGEARQQSLVRGRQFVDLHRRRPGRAAAGCRRSACRGCRTAGPACGSARPGGASSAAPDRAAGSRLRRPKSSTAPSLSAAAKISPWVRSDSICWPIRLASNLPR